MKKQVIYTVVGVIALVMVMCIGIYNASNQTKQIVKKRYDELYNCVEKYGLKDVNIKIDEDKSTVVYIYCSNIVRMDWNSVFDMNEELYTISDVQEVNFIQGNEQDGLDVYIYDNRNEIHTRGNGYYIEYNGAWDNKETYTEEEMDQMTLEKELDYLITVNECIICGKQATERIDANYYCYEHYEDVVEWYVEQALDND